VVDNHRPLHLKNIQREAVTVFVEDYEIHDGAPLDFEEEDLDTDADDSDGEGLEDDGDEAESEDEDEDDDDLDIEKEQDADEESNDVAEEEGEEEGDEGVQEEKAVEGGDEEAAASGGQEDIESETEAVETEENKEPVGATEKEAVPESETVPEDGAGMEAELAEGEAAGEEEAKADDDEDEDEAEVLRVKKRRKLDPKKELRDRVSLYKNMRASYGKPSSWMLFELTSGRSNFLDTIWQAILGVTDQYERQRLDEDQYEEIFKDLHLQLANYLSSRNERKYTVGDDENKVVVPGAQTGHIEDAHDYRFFLYRHWSLFDAMCFSPYVAAKMKTWKKQGSVRLQEMLAKMGISLEECKQMYQFMAPESKNHFSEKINDPDIKGNYFLHDPNVTRRSFFRYNSFRNPVAACDVVHAATALVEQCSTSTENISFAESSRLQAFNEAYDCLGMHADEKLKKGLKSAIDLQKLIVRKAGVVLEDSLEVIHLKRLYYIRVETSTSKKPQAIGDRQSHGSNGNTDDEVDSPFSRPMVLARLGQYIMDVKMNMDKRREQGWTQNKLLPLLLRGEERDGKCFLVGIDPRVSILGNKAREGIDMDSLDNLCNFKGMFKASARGLGVIYPGDAFDANIVELPAEYADDFVYNLSIWLRGASRIVA
jgi:hypothetical protein